MMVLGTTRQEQGLEVKSSRPYHTGIGSCIYAVSWARLCILLCGDSRKQSAREFSLTSATSKMAARPHLDEGHLALNV